jgi:hypothetical protein
MHFTIDRAAFLNLLRAVSIKKGRRLTSERLCKIFVVAPRVFVVANDFAAATEALVLRGGKYAVEMSKLRILLETYKPRVNSTFEVEGNSMRFGSTTMGVEKASDVGEVPAIFQDIPAIPTATDDGRARLKR